MKSVRVFQMDENVNIAIIFPANLFMLNYISMLTRTASRSSGVVVKHFLGSL